MKTKTPKPGPLVRDLLTEHDRGSEKSDAYRLIGCGFPAHPVPKVDPRILASPNNPCPFTKKRRIA